MKLLLIGFRTIVRLVQGPCFGNQEFFTLHTELLVSINRVIRSIRVQPPKIRVMPSTSFLVDTPNSKSEPPGLGSPNRSSMNSSRKSGAANFLRRQSSSNRGVSPLAISDAAQPGGVDGDVFLYEQGLSHLEKIKEAVIDVIGSITEAQHRRSLVFERVFETIDFSKIIGRKILTFLQTLNFRRCSSHTYSTNRFGISVSKGQHYSKVRPKDSYQQEVHGFVEECGLPRRVIYD